MKRYIFPFLIPLLLSSFQGKAQSTLGIGQYSSIISNDTLPAYATDSISYWVINYGTSIFNDNLYVFTSVQDSSGFLYHIVDTTYPGIVTILPGDSILVNASPFYDIDPVYRYHYDINVIVIWPVALTGSTTVIDSLQYNEFILLPQSVDEIDIDKIIKAYPNPALHYIDLENSRNNSIEEVRIYNSLGKLVATIKKPQKICVEDWPPGVYLLSVLFDDKQMRTIRVVKQ